MRVLNIIYRITTNKKYTKSNIKISLRSQLNIDLEKGLFLRIMKNSKEKEDERVQLDQTRSEFINF